MIISAVIPAYNEEERIESVIIPALNSDIISNIIVVDDGSDDSTSDVVLKYDNIDLIKMNKNCGKAAATKRGIEYCLSKKSDIIILLDADLIGLTTKHIELLTLPVLDKGYDMTIGIFKSGRLITDLAQLIAPNLSGQRAMKAYIANEILDLQITGYGIEMSISKLIKKHNLNVHNVVLENVGQITKEEKIGFIKGVMWRIKMYKDIVKHWIE